MGECQNPYNHNPYNHNPYCVEILIGFVEILIGFVEILIGLLEILIGLLEILIGQFRDFDCRDFDIDQFFRKKDLPVSSGGSVKEQQLEDVEYEPTMKEKQSHRDFHEEDLECEPTMVALHGLAASIRQGADRESREAFKILIQEYRPKGCSK